MASSGLAKGGTAVSPVKMAVLAGGTAALVIFLLPPLIFESLADITGLSSILGADPSLDMAARIILASGTALATGLIAWIVPQLMDGKNPKRPKISRVKAKVDEEIEYGSVDANDTGLTSRRRSFANLDLEPRRPIYAESDLGTPFTSVTAQKGHAVSHSPSAFSQHFDEVENNTAPEYSDMQPNAGINSEYQDEDPYDPNISVENIWQSNLIITEDVEKEEAHWGDIPNMPDTIPNSAAFSDNFAANEWAEAPEFQEIGEAQPDFHHPISPATDEDMESLATLVCRLEAGVARKRLVRAMALTLPDVTIPETAQHTIQIASNASDDMDEALRDALGTLQRMAARNR